MNKLVDKIINCLHWFDMFFPGKKDKIDWKDVGQMRSRLVKMRAAESMTSVSTPIKTAENNGSMLVNFRSMSSDRDKQSLSRWYKKECVVTREKQLSARIVEGQRAHEARQTSGQYEALKAEDAEAIYEANKLQLSKEAEAKLADFLSGTSDDINDLLFANLTTSEDIQIEHEDDALQLSSTEDPGEANQNLHSEDDMPENCTSMAAARSRRSSTASKSTLRRRKKQAVTGWTTN